MAEHDSAMLFGPARRVFRQKYDRRYRSPGKRSADNGAREKAHVASHASFCACFVENGLPIGTERPRPTSDVTETNSPNCQPGKDQDEAGHPEQWQREITAA